MGIAGNRIEGSIEGLRLRIGGGIRVFISGSQQVPQNRLAPAAEGLDGPRVAMQAVHSDVAGLVGGLRALLIQTLHPLVMAGVAEHSNYRSDPLGRLHRTGAFLGATTFGAPAEAAAAISTVRQIHSRVNGTAADGRTYSATDPRLLSWVHCTEVESFLRARVRYGKSRLPDGFEDRYVAEMAVIGRRLGVTDAPLDVAGLDARLGGFRSELAVDHLARDAVRFLIWPPSQHAVRGPYLVLFGAAVGLLPGYARELLKLPLPPLSDPLIIRPAARLLLRGIAWALDIRPSDQNPKGPGELQTSR